MKLSHDDKRFFLIVFVLIASGWAGVHWSLWDHHGMMKFLLGSISGFIGSWISSYVWSRSIDDYYVKHGIKVHPK
jgi:hypothetical protein